MILPAPPFLGIAVKRPYPPTGLTTARWQAEVGVRQVPFDTLYLTQNHLRIHAMLGDSDKTLGDSYPHVVQFNNELFLEDGHHRVLRTVLSTDAQAMDMRVYDVGRIR